MEPSDEELCRRAGERDEQAFELLVQRHQARAYRLACSLLGKESDARDVSQQAFIRLYESAHRFEQRSRFTTWFYRILVNLCIDHQRRNRWWAKLVPLPHVSDEADAPTLDLPSPGPDPEAEVMRSQTMTRLTEALGRLSQKQRVALLLQVQEGFSSGEIAAVLNCSESTARVHVYRAITALRKALKEI